MKSFILKKPPGSIAFSEIKNKNDYQTDFYATVPIKFTVLHSMSLTNCSKYKEHSYFHMKSQGITFGMK